MSKKKSILLISPEPWSYIFVSKHHYASELALLGHRVFFLNPPDPSNYRCIHITVSEIRDLYIINYPGQLKGMRFLPGFFRRQINRKFLHELEKLTNQRVDIIWNFENSRFFDMSFAKNRLKIYHQVDLNQDFHVKEAATSADICFCTTDYIKSQLHQYNKSVYKIHHGVSREVFNNFEPQQQHTNPVATLVGNLDIPYLDNTLLLQLITENPGVAFKLVGSYEKKGDIYRLLSGFRNVQFTGRVKSEEIKKYLAQSDILLVCYKADEFKEQLASPHKMMEYFASGKVIVATYTDEYKDKQHLLLMSSSNSEYVPKFREAINNPGIYNAPEKQAERIAFALDHTYSKQIEKINELLKRHQFPELL